MFRATPNPINTTADKMPNPANANKPNAMLLPPPAPGSEVVAVRLTNGEAAGGVLLIVWATGLAEGIGTGPVGKGALPATGVIFGRPGAAGEPGDCTGGAPGAMTGLPIKVAATAGVGSSTCGAGTWGVEAAAKPGAAPGAGVAVWVLAVSVELVVTTGV
jgi:hypothetical protein